MWAPAAWEVSEVLWASENGSGEAQPVGANGVELSASAPPV